MTIEPKKGRMMMRESRKRSVGVILHSPYVTIIIQVAAGCTGASFIGIAHFKNRAAPVFEVVNYEFIVNENFHSHSAVLLE